MQTIYDSALSACFDHAGRRVVEQWQDNHTDDHAEQIAREFLLALQESDVIRAVTFSRTLTGADQIIIQE